MVENIELMAYCESLWIVLLVSWSGERPPERLAWRPPERPPERLAWRPSERPPVKSILVLVAVPVRYAL